ncbi:MAG: hypothetical protein F4139_10365 [Gemmatimonadetes bacterium]|nr:hypothetical protein [Gemmatimonadota bacterium]MYB98120.1 hypothetical protein [Gemmatimonadota bacterium]MYH53339.1 hypothetical protein [Gemmatimonadota bacterium]MYI45941.1 hypothetical protein [Gemmatimonadota bacterium]MYK65353.1 hypothetical protein [Gemmatimonadota bacterium]
MTKAAIARDVGVSRDRIYRWIGNWTTEPRSGTRKRCSTGRGDGPVEAGPLQGDH